MYEPAEQFFLAFVVLCVSRCFVDVGAVFKQGLFDLSLLLLHHSTVAPLISVFLCLDFCGVAVLVRAPLVLAGVVCNHEATIC